MRRAAAHGFGALAGTALILAVATTSRPVTSSPAADAVATGVSRPLQLVVDGGALVVLSPCARGECAGEIHRFDLDGELPVDLSRQPRVRVPFIDSRMATLGSLALNPATRELFLGEENGTRVYRLSDGKRLTLYATGLHRLAGGSTLALDRLGRLVIMDYVDQTPAEDEGRAPPGLEPFRDEDYRGPLVFRLTPDPTIPLPRRLDRLAPLFPRAWGGKTGGALLPRLISVAPLATGDLVFLTSVGELYRLAEDGTFALFTRLPPGQYNRTNMVAAADGAVFVSGGFHIGRIFSVSRDGDVRILASNLADPEGIALDARGNVYVAESALHRIIRLRPL